MSLFHFSVTCLALLSVAPTAVTGQALSAPAHFYPYGPGVGDSTAPVNDDGSTGSISISTSFPYFDQNHRSLYVNTNGLISFLLEVDEYTPDAFPLSGNKRFVAAFWADVDTTENAGRVYYRQVTYGSLLQRATTDVRGAFSVHSSFTASWVFIASWHKVTYYGGSTSSSLNTFQIVLITNGRHSFTIFNYGDITWTAGSASNGIPAQVGFNAGDGRRYFSVPGSRTASIVNVETTSNVGLRGRWVFRIDEADVVVAGSKLKP
ncbi:hypothetical protein NP493_1225g02057 [Ridgeia piscesae]|uniref:NIDO domain-containing protein n=1 Tax=Ridgeia piscesae TaxID=27915 RepID=A0AAD9NFT0_RIDPI|nr:hypothetical protein NP493_1225g02057 [Ridgeia piscesae]